MTMRVSATSALVTSSLLFGALRGGSSTGSCAEGSSGFDLLNDTLTSLSSLVKLGFDASDALLDCHLLVTDLLSYFFLHFLIVNSGFFSRISPVGSGAIELLLNLGLLDVGLTLFLLLKLLSALKHLLVVGLGLLKLAAEHLGLTLLS